MVPGRVVMERDKGQEWVSPSGGHWAVDRKGGVVIRSIATYQ